MSIFVPGSQGQVPVQIANRIVGEIIRSRLALGDRLPPYRVLARRYKVGHMTVLRALSVLQERGIVSALPRRGTVVEHLFGLGHRRIAYVNFVHPNVPYPRDSAETEREEGFTTAMSNLGLSNWCRVFTIRLTWRIQL